MATIYNYDCHGTLTVGGVSLTCPAWAVLDLWALWSQFSVRGEDRLLPGAAGVVPYKRRIEPVRFDLRFLVIGDVDEDGVPYPDPVVGLETNLATLWTSVLQPTLTGDGTRAAVLTLPSGATRTANIHVLGFEPIQAYLTPGYQAALDGVLPISVPAGRFS